MAASCIIQPIFLRIKPEDHNIKISHYKSNILNNFLFKQAKHSLKDEEPDDKMFKNDH